jgi:hypothetical protein
MTHGVLCNANALEIRACLHAKQAHLSPEGTRGGGVFADVAGGVGVNVPAVFFFFAVFAAGGAPASFEAFLCCRSRVPAKGPGYTVEPLGVGADDGGEGVLRRRDGDVVSLPKLDTPLAIECAVGSGAAVSRDGHAQEHRVGKNHGSERKRVWADGCEENGGDVGVDKRATSRE